MRFASLGSGSKGNAWLVCAGKTCLMVDNGFSIKSCQKRLSRLSLPPESITALLLTHEHSDHAAGAIRLARLLSIPIWMTEGTRLALGNKIAGMASLRLINSDRPFALEEIEVLPVSVPHDAREPVQYVFSDGAHRLGLLTDLGHITPHVKASFQDLDALVLECNHEPELLQKSAYPYHLKERIAGNFGHLSNLQAQNFLASSDRLRLQHIVAAHLSAENNHPDLAALALSQALNGSKEDIVIATQEEGLSWRVLQ